MQMKRDFLDQLLVELHQEGEIRTRTEKLDEACEKFNRVFHPKDAMTNLSVRLKIDRDYWMIDQQRVSHVHPTQRSSLGRDRYETSKLDVKLRFASRAPYHELFIEEVPFLVSDIYRDVVGPQTISITHWGGQRGHHFGPIGGAHGGRCPWGAG